MKSRVLLLFLLGLLTAGAPRQAFAWDGAFFDLFQVPFSAREAALGGKHAAQADDISTLQSNPAGFRSVNPELSIGAVSMSVYSGPNTAALQNTTYDLFGPLAIAYVGNGLGFGIFTDTNLLSRTRGPSPNGNAQATENLVAIAGFAFRIPLPESWRSTLDVGFSIPIFLALRSDSRQDARALFSSQITPVDFIAQERFTSAAGVSGELGLLYILDDTFSVGIAGRNLALTTSKTYTTFADYQQGIAPISTSAVTLPIDISIGVRWNPPIKSLIPSIDGFSIMADYNDAFDFVIYPAQARNPLLHFGLGAEITLLRAVKLRAGFYQLLPCGGLSLDLSFFTIDLAVFGRELSKQPWTTPVYGYMASLRFHT
jgi:hypothetical protein